MSCLLGGGPLDEPFERLVRLGADDTVAAGDERGHARHAELPREGPVLVDGVLEGPLLDHFARLVDREADLLDDVQDHVGIADVPRFHDGGAAHRVVNGLAARLRVRPLADFLSEAAVVGHGALAVRQALGVHARLHLCVHGLAIHAAPGEQVGQRAAFHRRFRVKREVHPLDLYVVLGPELLNTHGTEIAPGSDVVGEDLDRQQLAHATSFMASLKRRSTSRWPSGNARPAPRGSAMTEVAPSAFHAFTCFTQPLASCPARRMRPSIGSFAGSRPASRAYSCTRATIAPPCASGVRFGLQPSASRPMRRSAGSGGTAWSRLPTPNQMGIGRWIGMGLSPAWLIRWNSPRNSTTGRVHRARSTATCSAARRPRLSKVSLSASYSTAFQPTPIPRRRRPPLSTSICAACLATSAVCRCGRIRMPVASVMRLVMAARYAMSVSASCTTASCE